MFLKAPKMIKHETIKVDKTVFNYFQSFIELAEPRKSDWRDFQKELITKRGSVRNTITQSLIFLKR